MTERAGCAAPQGLVLDVADPGADHAVDPQRDNLLVQGDNLVALQALLPALRGQVKCVYLDPPYNTGRRFDHYDDDREHGRWLRELQARLSLVHGLLAEDGSLWVSMDDHEVHYLKVCLDGIFGRENFVDTVIWQKIYTRKNSARHFSAMHDHILVYAKDRARWRLNLLPREVRQDRAYRNPDDDPRGPWKSTPLHARNPYSLGRYPIVAPDGRRIEGPPSGTYWRVSEANFLQLEADGRIWWGRDGKGAASQKRFLSEVKAGLTPTTLWTHDEVGHNGEAKHEQRALFPDEDTLFLTPKPERLLKRILELASAPGDLVLDAYAGSGTTGAVAHKLGRRWCMIEQGTHCQTLVAARMAKVVAGEDPGGITTAVGWTGGGSFRVLRTAREPARSEGAAGLRL